MRMFTHLAGASNVHRRMEALRGGIFYASNPTVGTGITLTANTTAYSAVLGMMNIYNSATPNSVSPQVEWIVPIALQLRATQANTSGTSYHLTGYLDVGTRYSSGGSAITPVTTALSGVTGYTARTSKATIHFGALTIAAATASEKKVFDLQVSDVVFAADDTVWVVFGGENVADGAGNAYLVPAPPVWIGPGANLSIHEWSPSASDDAAWTFNFYYAEFPSSS